MKSLSILLLSIAGLGIAACSDDSDPVSAPGDTEIALHANLWTYAVAELGSLGGTSSAGNSISNHGPAGSSNLPGDQTMHAALWQNGAPLDMGTLGGPNSGVLWPGQNNGGMIVGVAETDELDPNGEDWSCSAFFPTVTGNICLGFVWEPGTGMTPLPTFGGFNGFATGVNAQGQVVGWAETEVEDPTCNAPQVLQFRAALWEPRSGEMTELPPLPGDSTSAATGINNRGQVVGISGECDVAVGRFSAQHAVLWEDGVPRDIGNLGGDSWHTPMAINARGDVVGFSNPPAGVGGAFRAHAFLWTEGGGIEDLGTLPGNTSSQALGINARGQVVGLSSGGTGGLRAFLYQDGVMTDLNTLVPGYDGRLLFAGDINDAGLITGAALDADTGDVVTFVATPVGANP
jgi:probable HAF family extracellular repeat protein